MQILRIGQPLTGVLVLGVLLAFGTALLFPILVTAGERSPQASCQSNLREIGAAILMYMEDYDGSAPLARSVEIDADPLVREGGPLESPFILTGGPELLSPRLGHCPPLDRPGLWPLHLLLDAYTSRHGVWQDPKDGGDLTLRTRVSPTGPAPQSAFAAYGASYQYHQGLVWRASPAPALPGTIPMGRVDPVRREQLAAPAETPLVFDGEGYWHGAAPEQNPPDPDPYLAATAARGYNVFFADGRVRFIPAPVLLNRAPGRPLGLLYQDPRQ